MNSSPHPIAAYSNGDGPSAAALTEQAAIGVADGGPMASDVSKERELIGTGAFCIHPREGDGGL